MADYLHKVPTAVRVELTKAISASDPVWDIKLMAGQHRPVTITTDHQYLSNSSDLSHYSVEVRRSTQDIPV